jgi:ribosomal protein S18 acetylase RimI-like enzyme
VNSCFSCSFFPYSLEKTDKLISASAITIRSAEAGDLKKLADVLTFSFHPPQKLLSWVYPLLKLGVYEDLRSRLRSASPHYRCLVACQQIIDGTLEETNVVGTVELSLRSPWPLKLHTAYISNLAVSPHYRRQGVARSLLIKCEQVAFEWGFEEIFLHVLEDNLAAKQLYLKSGYQLNRIDFTVNSLLWNRPKRLLLKKKIVPNSY